MVLSHHDPAPGFLAVLQGIPVTEVGGGEKAALLGRVCKCGPKTHLVPLAHLPFMHPDLRPLFHGAVLCRS